MSCRLVAVGPGLQAYTSTSRHVGIQAYPSVYHVVRRRSHNSTPYIGSGPARSPRVGHGRSSGGSHPTSPEGDFAEFLVPSPRENPVASGVRSAVLSPGRSGVPGRAASSGRCSAVSPRIYLLGSFVGRFHGSFATSHLRSPRLPIEDCELADGGVRRSLATVTLGQGSGSAFGTQPRG